MIEGFYQMVVANFDYLPEKLRFVYSIPPVTSLTPERSASLVIFQQDSPYAQLNRRLKEMPLEAKEARPP